MLASLDRLSKHLLLSLFAFGLIAVSCGVKGEPELTFSGTKDAAHRAENMFDAIGGKEAWCGLRSLYIKAEHTEPQMTIPYTSEIWRAIDTFEIVIEQQNDSFHVKGVITGNKGEIHYLDKRDTFRVLSDEQLDSWKFDHEHNVYVLLNKLACRPNDYMVRISEDIIEFYQDSVYVVGFGLDSLKRPHLFYPPNQDGSVSGSMFSRWATHNGLVHSAGGHPLDRNFIYLTEIWEPSTESLRDHFGDKIFQVN